ncbi:uncharacterized protein FIBRA_03970 [Fibroporia radiculosa]|uniref:Protein YAE1 n=1 Tax=Fibroporia radiculosa TaxID=599839 RepID=J4H2P8_9APHY|nr:uncharacterized protein FIBRA_03970 [Fibroporia radiculosa]CCM01899.1 predicted protein [Fibroporia radiculosa]
MDNEDIWNADPKAVQDSEWSRLSSNFTTAGYREGITSGKESALQAGFDEGFAEIGTPLGRELGILRGVTAALLSSLTRNEDMYRGIIEEVLEIGSRLGAVRLTDIAPPDLEAERHAREHLSAEDESNVGAELNEEVKERRDMERLEDMMLYLGNDSLERATRPTIDDVHHIKEHLLSLCARLSISLQWN